MAAKKTSADQGRLRKALELRKAGLSFEEIAERLQYKTPLTAQRAVQTAVKKGGRESRCDARQIEHERLNRLLLAVWPKAIGGDEKAIDRALKIMERRARLLGLNRASASKTSCVKSSRRNAGTKLKSNQNEELPHDPDAVAEILAVLAEAGCFTAPPAGTDEAASQ